MSGQWVCTLNQYLWCAQMIILLIPDFEVSTAILNPMDVSAGGASWVLDLCETG